MGKGVALRSALRLADEKIGESDFYITADCDGQYSPEDIEKVAKELLNNPEYSTHSEPLCPPLRATCSIV